MRSSVLALSILVAVSAAACKKAEPCSDYVDAVADCYAGTDTDAPEGYDLATQCPNGGTLSDAYYTCLAKAYTDGDCSTVEGAEAIADAIGTCKP